MSNAQINTCGGVLYDSGGANNNYTNNENLTTTICSDGSDGTHIQLYFNNIDVRAGDLLCFYDGTGTSAPQISCILDFGFQGPLVVQAGADNTSGCITVTFSSNSDLSAAGWNALISCTDACQEVIAELASTTPPSVPATDGWIDICQGDDVQFSARGMYPDNGILYTQSDNTSSFLWDFGDGTTATGRNVNHRYDTPGGYVVQLQIEDVNGCRNTNFIQQRVRVAPPIELALTGDIPTQLCQDATLLVNSNLETGDTDIMATVSEATFGSDPSYSDTLFVPDGLNEYATSIEINQFTPGQLLTDINDILGICLNMEHSYLFDLGITITCPSGNSVTLQNYEGFIPHKINLGEPVQNAADPCDSSDETAGVGYDYCFEQSTPNGTMTAAALGVEDGGVLQAGSYASYESLEALLGCPLNGEWTIRISDNLVCDNGWIFAWNIDFDESILPEIETFTPTIVDWNWKENINISNSTSDFMISIPQVAGTTNYTFEATDDFGCSSSLDFNVNFLPFTHPQCYDCAGSLTDIADGTICEGDSTSLNVNYQGNLLFTQGFRATPQEAISFDNHPPATPYSSRVNVTNIFPTILNNPTTHIESVCINMQTPATQDINITLQTPSGQRITLVEDVPAGSHFINTCFTPAASDNITSGTAPFTGNFQPLEDWSNLLGSSVNGFWRLRISDASGNDVGILENWTLTFLVENELSYTWNNTSTLSCDTCTTVEATPATTTNYTIQASDLYGCMLTEGATVEVIPILDSINLFITDMIGGQVFVEWEDNPAATGYQVMLNNDGWLDVGNTNTMVFSTFEQGDPVHIEVLPYTEPTQCDHPISEVMTVFDTCYLAIELGLVSNPSCAGSSDGVVSASVLNGEPPYEFSLNGQPYQSLSIYQNLPAGQYNLIVRDARDCIEVLPVTLTDPPLLEASAIATDVLCFGAMNGTLTGTATGGTGTYTYAWNIPNQSGAVVDNVGGGNYTLTVTDANGCTATTTQTIAEPDSMMVNVVRTPTSCYGGSDGTAMVSVAGGTPGYTYQWTGGLNGASVTNLAADTYFLTVTDANGCTTVETVQIDQPAPTDLTVTTTAVLCSGENNGTATVENMGIAPFTYFWDDPNNQTTQTAQDLAAGNYSVTVTDGNGCQGIGIGTVDTPTELQLTTTNQATRCVGSDDGQAGVAVLGGVPPYTFVWNDANNQTTSTATNLAPGNYTVTVTDANNCTATASAAVTEAIPITLTQDSTYTSCPANADGSVSVMAMGGTGNYTYLWDDPTSQTTNIATNLFNGTYSVTITDENDCTASTSVTVISDDPITIDTIMGVTTQCFGSNNGSAMVIASGGNGAYSYVWSDANMQLSNPAINLFAGTYTVTVSDQSSCSQTATVEITQPSLLEINTSSEPLSCYGANTGSAAATPSGGTPPYTYLWSDANAQTDSLAVNLAAGNYRVTVTDNNGCTQTTLVNIAQPDSPIFSVITQIQQGCFGESQNSLEIALSGGSENDYMVEWSNGDMGTVATDVRAGWQYASITDANNCTKIDSFLVEDLAPIEANIVFSEPSCHDYLDGQIAVNIIMGGAGNGVLSNYDYVWSTTPPQNGPVANNVGGNQEYFITITDALGCAGIDSIMVTEPAPIEVTANVSNVQCFDADDGSINIEAVSSDNTNFDLVWSPNVGGQIGLLVENLAPDTYFLTVTDDDGCSLVNTYFITEPNPIHISIDSTDTACHGASLGNAAASAQGGISPYSYDWSNGGGNNTISDLAAGVYTVTVTDANGCQQTDSTFINEPSPLSATITATPPDCFNNPNATIQVNGLGGTAPYAYRIDTEDFSTDMLFENLSSGTYQVQVQDNNGCLWDSIAIIDLPAAFELILETDVFLQLGDTTQFFTDYINAVGVPEFEWTSLGADTSLSCTFCPNPTVAPISSNGYELYAIDENGCEDTQIVQVYVQRNAEIMVPTIFSPNGDGLNDLLHVHGKSEGVEKIQLFQVYDRWGELVYENRNFAVNDMSIGWDGTFNNNDLPKGVYVWYLEAEYIDGKVRTFKGNTTLMR